MRIILFANTDWFLYNFKRSLAERLQEAGHELILLSPPGPYGERLRQAGFRWEAFALSRSGVNPLQEWLSLRRLGSLYKALKPDLVHHFTIKCVIYGSIAARRAGIRQIVNSVTGLGFALLADTVKARLIRPLVVGLYRYALRHTQVVFQNAANRDTLARLGVLKHCQVALIPGDGIDTSVFVPAPQPAGRRVLMMCRLLRSKGVAEFVAAARIVRQKHADVRFQLAGARDPGNPECIDTETLDGWARENLVEFLGQRDDVLALQQQCTIAVLASTQGEGMPRALLEAAACARPLVASRVAGCEDVVLDGENGWLVPAGDAKALANALICLLEDKELASRMGQAARARVVALYADKAVNEKTMALYTQSR